MPTKEEQVKELLIELAEGREKVSAALAAKKSREEQPGYIAALRILKTHSDALKPIESKLRALGLEIFKEKGDKDIGLGLKHTERDVLDYDEAEAIEYCINKFFDGLGLDKKTFEKHAKGSKYPLDFVTISKSESVSIPKKINAAVLEKL